MTTKSKEILETMLGETIMMANPALPQPTLGHQPENARFCI